MGRGGKFEVLVQYGIISNGPAVFNWQNKTITTWIRLWRLKHYTFSLFHGVITLYY